MGYKQIRAGLTETNLIEFTSYVCKENGGSFLAWIGSYLTGRDQFVRASGSQSTRFSVRSGVCHGSHLGPLLFTLFINDVFSCFKSLRILLYADDLKIFFPVVHRQRDAAQLEEV
jgi:hypothetical protein